MAWLQNLAGHAENLLNKIDQNAATVLNEPNKVFGEDFLSEANSGSLSNHIPDSHATELLPILNDSEGYRDTVFTSISEKPKPPNYGTTDENIMEKSLNSSPSSSSIQHSFLLTQELDALHAKIAQLESDNQDVNKEMLNMHHLFSELRNENNNLRFHLERTIEELTVAQQEKDQYIARAQRILQEKERMLALKETSSSSEAEQNLLTNYTKELKKELEFQQTKVIELTDKNRTLTNEMESLQLQHQLDQKKLHQTIKTLEENILLEKRNRMLAEEDCSQKAKDLHAKINDILQCQEIIKSKNEEIEKLKIAVRQKIDTNHSEEYENRIKSLTQTLMLKQQNLETITTERNALRFQLEKIETEHRREIALLKKDQVKVINMQDIHEERITVPHFMRVSPHDRGVTRRVKQTYSTLDAISVRTGIFLRRYPVARVFVFTYIVILHMWVLLVLFWYVPSNR